MVADVQVVAGPAVGPEQRVPNVDERQPFLARDVLADQAVGLLLFRRPATSARVSG